MSVAHAVLALVMGPLAALALWSAGPLLAILTAPFVSSLCVLGAAFMTARRSRERLERLPRTLAATMTLPQSSSPIVLSGAKS